MGVRASVLNRKNYVRHERMNNFRHIVRTRDRNEECYLKMSWRKVLRSNILRMISEQISRKKDDVTLYFSKDSLPCTWGDRYLKRKRVLWRRCNRSICVTSTPPLPVRSRRQRRWSRNRWISVHQAPNLIDVPSLRHHGDQSSDDGCIGRRKFPAHWSTTLSSVFLLKDFSLVWRNERLS